MCDDRMDHIHWACPALSLFNYTFSNLQRPLREMNITDIKVNPSNHSEYDKDVIPWSTEWHNLMNQSVSLNDYLDEKSPTTNTDNAGHYAYLLDSIGIYSNSDNGWWSLEAVMPENIEYFIKILNDEEVFVRFNKAKLRYKSMQPLVSHNCKTIEEFVNLFNPKEASNG